ncbi:ABC transporter permease [Streptococcus fryi]
MLACLTSEFLKFKNSPALQAISLLTGAKLLILPLYLAVSNSSYSWEAIIFLPLLADCLVVSLVTIFTYEQEMVANHCQHLKVSPSIWKLCLSKILIIDILLACPTLLVWLAIGVLFNMTTKAFLIGCFIWSFAIWLNHFHSLLTLAISRTSNLMIAFVECLIVIFASNRVFLSSPWIPMVLPINNLLAIHDGGASLVIMPLLSYLALSLICNLYFISYHK